MFIERLSNLLNERHLTRSKFLSDLKMGKNQFTYWEKTGAIPNNATLNVIANYFNVSVDYLTGNDDLMQKALDILDEKESSEQEKALLTMFRSTSEEGRLRIIQAVMNICDEIEKKPTTSTTEDVG